jgi:23S rRNA (cytosine1962-C5)-methyltransferase
VPDRYPVVRLKPGHEKPVLRRHPWLFSGAVATAPSLPAGAVVDVQAADGRFLARGYYNLASQIRVRLLTWDPEEPVDEGFWIRRLEGSLARRQALYADPDTTACRLVHAEADFLPGLIVDRYGTWLVVQALTAGIEVRREELVRLLAERVAPAGVYERSDELVRRLEGLELRAGPMRGPAPPPEVEIHEDGRRYLADLMRGQKTGFYLDQRENRSLVAGLVAGLSAGCRVLNVFSYTGGFSVAAAAHGAASVTEVESSAAALETSRRNLALNPSCSQTRVEAICGDAFTVLRQLREQQARFDLVVLDPPKFAPRAPQVPGACRAYKDINLLAFQLLEVGGWLATFSCSGLVTPDLFQKVVFGAALDAGVEAQLVRPLVQAADHPVLLSFPESLYLKGLLCRRVA